MTQDSDLDPPVPVIVDFPGYGRGDEAKIIGTEQDPFDSGSVSMTWMPKVEHRVAVLGDQIIAHAGLVTSRVLVGGRHELIVAGFGGVIVARAWRGTGLAQRLMTATEDRARCLADHGLLFCHDNRRGFYERLGWAAVEPDIEVVVEQPDGPVRMPMRSMWRAFRPAKPWPDGDIRLLSLPM